MIVEQISERSVVLVLSANRGGIDYILYSKGIESKYFTAIGDADVLGASDHKPVMADLAVSAYTFPTTKPTSATTTTTTVPYYTTERTTYGSVVINKTTTGNGEETTTQAGETTTAAPDAETTAGEEETSTTANNKDPSANKKPASSSEDSALPWWVWAIIGAIGLVIVGSIVAIILLLSKK